MCRFAAYIGTPLLLNDVVSKPHDSLIKQSLNAEETDIKINADGFGIGWYNAKTSDTPSVYVNILPAGNDINLRSMSHNIESSCFFGHVRAAAMGGVSLYNCHPFCYQKWLFMHNGGVGGFSKFKLDLFQLLEYKLFSHIKGQTDSESLFMLWLTYYLRTDQKINDMISSWRKTLSTIEKLQKKHNIHEPSYINATITDGGKLVALRYSTDPKYYLTLHYCAGKSFIHSKYGFYMIPADSGKNPESVLVASEKISVHKSEWTDVPTQAIFCIDKDKSITIENI